MSRALVKVIERARRSPFYANFLPKNVTWENMPITTKADLRNGYPFGFLATDRNKIASYHESSGTEGKPISSYFSESDWNDIASRFLRNGVKLSSQDTFFIKTPYSMVTTAHQAHAAGKLAKALIVPADNRTSNMSYPRVIQLLKDIDVTVTWSLPTEVLLWGLVAKHLGLNPRTDFPALRAFWVAGEALSPGKRLMLKKLWGNKAIFEDYGSTETGSLAGECREGSLHVWDDKIHFEVFSPKTSKIARLGRGQLLVTPLYREAMPLIRYLIEDEVELKASQCGCASSRPTLRVLGRDSDKIITQGKTFYPSDLEDTVYRSTLPYDVYFWRASYDRLRLDIEFSSAAPMALQVKHAIFQAVADRLDVKVTVERKAQSEFVAPEIFSAPHSFAKPKFVLRKDTYENNYPTLR